MAMTRAQLRAELDRDRRKRAALDERLAALGIRVTATTRTASTLKRKATHAPRVSQATAGSIAKAEQARQAKPQTLIRLCSGPIEIR